MSTTTKRKRDEGEDEGPPNKKIKEMDEEHSISLPTLAKMDNIAWGFDVLPAEIKQLIISFANMDLIQMSTVLTLQCVSSEFKKICWPWVRTIDRPITADILNRINVDSIRYIDCKKWKDPVPSVLAALKVLPNISAVFCNFEHGDDDYKNLVRDLSEFDQHPKLIQIDYPAGFWLRSAPNVQFIQYKYNMNQHVPLELTKKDHHCGGKIGQTMHVIGATDGTLTFLTLKHVYNSLHIHSTNDTIHKDCINAIWSENPKQTYIASKDGVVTSWSCKYYQLVLKHTFVFPESILFVCDHADKYVLAAGKRTLYIAEIEASKIIREVAIDDDITGLFANAQAAVLSTKDTLYSINDLTGPEVLQKYVDTSCPNLWLSPDASMRLIVHPTRVEATMHKTNSVTDSVTLDQCDSTRPLLARFSPTRYWMTFSTGTTLVTYVSDKFCKFYVDIPLQSLEKHRSIFELTPETTGQPTCNALWYSSDGYLFGLFSNNTVYWWQSTIRVYD